MEFVKDENTLNYMYRYLLKYVGTYRVRAYFDEITEDFPRNETGGIDDSFEDFYIKCSRNATIRSTYKGNDILCIYFENRAHVARNVFEELITKYKNIDIELDDSSSDGIIYFHAEDIKKIATIVVPRTAGCKIHPLSVKNLPKVEYSIPKEDIEKLNAIVSGLDRTSKMRFFKEVNSNFIKGVRKLDGKKFDCAEEFKKTRLGTREFIHSVGLWDRYLSYIKKNLPD